MNWKLSRFRAGDFVEVRRQDEIFATLDERGCVDDLPFMPEMLQYCGRRFRVRVVAHKTCETAKQTNKARRLDAAVLLEDLRCDGSFHGGCEAACSLFWKDVWLNPVTPESVPAQSASARPTDQPAYDLAQLVSATRAPNCAEAGPCYVCQATRLFDATEPIAWWDLRRYCFDVTTGNYPLGRVLRVIGLAELRRLVRWAGRLHLGYRFWWRLSDWIHRLTIGKGSPSLFHDVTPCVRTPVGYLDLQPGELVRIKSQEQIEATLDKNGRNRGLSFDPEEMAHYCGHVFRVRNRVARIVDESTGTMRHTKQPCIILEGVYCTAEYARGRINCPRAIPCYWREIWLERVDAQHGMNVGSEQLCPRVIPTLDGSDYRANSSHLDGNRRAGK